MTGLQEFLDGASVDPEVFERWPGYRALLLSVEVDGGPGDDASEELVQQAETEARALVGEGKPEELPHVAAWREAYRGFGAKPQRTRNSVEALLRRIDDGLPRINRVADIYNSISVRHAIPVGGEDLDAYVGSPRLAVATGEEDFATMQAGEDAVEHPDKGEVIWRDDEGATCRRWNWRQCRRTALRDDTRRYFFVFDAMEPFSDEELERCATELLDALGHGQDVPHARRLISAQG